MASAPGDTFTLETTKSVKDFVTIADDGSTVTVTVSKNLRLLIYTIPTSSKIVSKFTTIDVPSGSYKVTRGSGLYFYRNSMTTVSTYGGYTGMWVNLPSNSANDEIAVRTSNGKCFSWKNGSIDTNNQITTENMDLNNISVTDNYKLYTW